jgi:glycosyltransferase involved in cell wall biosynthesis
MENIGIHIKMSCLTRIFIINSLSMGGTERYLNNYLLNSNICNGERKILISLKKTNNFYADDLSCIDEHYVLNLRIFIWILMSELWVFNNRVIIQSFLYRSNLIGGLFQILSLFIHNHIIHIRSGNLQRSFSFAKIIQSFVATFSYLPRTNIIYNSHAGKNYHELIGFSRKHTKVIWNGTNISLNKHVVYDLIKKRQSILKKEINFLFVGRSDPLKNFNELKSAFQILDFQKLNVNLMVCGNHVKTEANITDKSRILYKGVIKEQSKIYCNKAHFLILPSIDEACPNAIIEAMSYGIPIVCTNAGDAWLMIGNSGIKIRGFSSHDIAHTLTKILKEIDFQEYKEIALSTWAESNKFTLRENVIQTDEYLKLAVNI